MVHEVIMLATIVRGFTTFIVHMFSKTFEILNIKLVIYLFTMSRSSLSVECLVNVGICFIRLCKRRKT